MIQIKKSSEIPAVLKERGANETESLLTKHRSGARRFVFKPDIYGHGTVKEELRENQHDKCCFCESKLSHIDYGDVEHFRPKGGWRQSEGDSLHQPGYYWLAYEWSNLFLSCRICNQRNKGNLFPLKDPDSRAMNNESDLSRETTLFIDPGMENPEKFISFRGEFAYSVNENARGAKTVDALELNRPKLVEERKGLFESMRALYQLTKVPKGNGDEDFQKDLENASRIVNEYAEGDKQYTAMIRAALKANFEIA